MEVIWVRGARPGHCAQSPGGGRNEGESRWARGDHNRMGYSSKLAHAPILHSSVGSSITDDKSGYNTDAHGVVANLMLKRLHTLIIALHEKHRKARAAS